MRIIYMGTPDFAVESLKRLVEAGKEVVAVVTMPDKPAGRGHKLQMSAVKKYALEVGIDVLQPENLKNEEFVETLRGYDADLQIVVAFRMLPEVVWNMPRLGTFNLHGSLLPRYRGAAPINWAVMNGDKETGITTFFLKHEIDTGDIIYQEKIVIEDEDNAGDVHDKLMVLGGELVLKTVEDIERGEVPSRAQEDIEATKAPKIFKDTCRIDFGFDGERIRNHVRGLSPHPAAWTMVEVDGGEELMLKVYKVRVEVSVHGKEIGAIECDGKKYLRVACNNGWVYMEDVQLSGKKRMGVEDLLRGLKVEMTKCR